MDTIIYRKSDNLVAGHVFSRRTTEQSEEALAVKINSICNSELGGIPDDYATIEIEQALRPGLEAIVNGANQVQFIEDPRVAAQNEVKASVNAKLAALGFTDEEIEAFRA
jgi:hypothetical protein